MIINNYLITYNNKISQIKSLINHDDYLFDVKPKYDEIHNLEVIISKLGKKKLNERKILENQISTLKKYIISNYGVDFFTTNSPLWINKDLCLLPQSFKSKNIKKYKYKLDLL